MQRRAFGILEAVRERLARDRRAAEPWVVVRDSAVGIEANHAAREVAAHVGLERRRVLGAVEIGVVEAECVGARHVHRAVAREYDAPLDAPLDEHFEVLEAAIVGRELRAAHALGAQIEHAALGERLVPDFVVVMLDGPLTRGFAFRRREIREVDVAVRREIRVEHDVMEALCGDDLDGRHAGDRLGHFAARRHGS